MGARASERGGAPADWAEGRRQAYVVLGPDEAAGAGMRVAGLTVLERCSRQLRRMGYEEVMVGSAEAAPPGAPVVRANVVRAGSRDLGGGAPVVDEDTRRRAEDAIFAELLRGDLGLVARHLNKPLSFRITRYLLCRLPVTPNQVTLGAAAVGLLGAGLVASGRYGLVVGGFLLAHVQSVLDGCDGELARVRFQQSAFGEWLDTVVDDAMNLALVAATGIGLSRASGSALPLGLGAAGCGMLLTYNVVAYRELVRQGEGGEVLKVRWWFARGRELKDLAESGARGLSGLLFQLGRRDVLVLGWAALAALGALPVVLGSALLVSATCFVVALGQLAAKR